MSGQLFSGLTSSKKVKKGDQLADIANDLTGTTGTAIGDFLGELLVYASSIHFVFSIFC